MYNDIRQAVPTYEQVEKMRRKVADPDMALAWAQTQASLRQFIELNGGGGK